MDKYPIPKKKYAFPKVLEPLYLFEITNEAIAVPKELTMETTTATLSVSSDSPKKIIKL